MKTFLRRIISSLIFFNVVQGVKGKSSLIKIRAAQFYIRGVRKARLLFIGILALVATFILLGSGLSLIHSALFTYSQWSLQVKFIAALILGAVEFLGAVIILLFVCREETWVKYSGIQRMVNSAIEAKSGNKK